MATYPTVAGPPSLTSLILKKNVLKPAVIVPAIAGMVPTCVVRLDLVTNCQSPDSTVMARPDTFKRQHQI